MLCALHAWCRSEELVSLDSMPTRTLELDKDKANPFFDSWKLDRSIELSQAVKTLDGSVKVTDHSTDYLNTRAAILHNHLHQVDGSYYVFQCENGSWSLHRLTSHPEAQADRAWEPSDSFQRSCIGSDKAAADAPLQPSVVAIEGGQPPAEQLIVSSGHGDLTLVNISNPSEAVKPCFPLHTRAMHLQAAAQLDADQIVVIAWAVRHKSSDHAAGCELFAITLGFHTTLEVKNVQLLQVSALPPHAVSLLPKGSYVIVASANPEAQDSGNEDSLLPSTGAASGLTADDDDVDSISPRTLRQAADRLAQFTSEQAADDAVPRNEFSDLYHEVGPDNVGGMGGEPACTVTLFKQVTSDPQPAPDDATVQQDQGHHQQRTATGPDAQPNVTAAPKQQMSSQLQSSKTNQDDGSSEHKTGNRTYQIVDQIDCGPHKVVASGQQQQILLGLSDDIDCAAVGFRSRHSALLVEHLHSIPALAYVSAGKVHKKFTLLAHPESKLAAALVEGNRFSYLYKQTYDKHSTGSSQIIDMGLEEQSAVLGTALQWIDGQDRLLILTSSQLLVYSITITS